VVTWIVTGCNGRLTQIQDTVDKFIPNNNFSVRFTILVIRNNNEIQNKVNLHVCNMY
jgi:hypothetical protein